MIADIKQIDGWESLTAEQIATALRQTGLTHRPIELGDLLFLLNNRGMLVRLIRPVDSGEKWAGTLVNLINHCNDTAHPLALHVNQFFSHITNDRNKTFDTTQRQYAGLFLLIVSTFAGQDTMPTLEDFSAVAGLGGGWLYADVTAEQVQTALEQEAARVAEEALKLQREQVRNTLMGAEWNTYVASVLDGPDPTVAGVIAGLRALADALEGV